VFLVVPAYPGSHGPKVVKRLCLCVCVCVCRVINTDGMLNCPYIDVCLQCFECCWFDDGTGI